MAKQQTQGSKLQIKSKYTRTFSEAFKRAKVKDLDAGLLSIKEICETYEVSRTSVYKWLYKYSPHHSKGSIQVVQMKSEAHKSKEFKQRISELEQALGRKQMELDYLNKLIELASEEFGYDLKKNFEAKHLSGSESKTDLNATK